jgi:hypothetical protein
MKGTSLPELDYPMDELRKCKLMVATPMYGGQCTGTYTQAMMQLTADCANMQIQMTPNFLFNESLITRARNYCCETFMNSDATHLMFIDSDIGFTSRDIFYLMAVTAPVDSPYDLIGGPYPKKTISWEKIVVAVNKGMGDENPEQLSRYVGDYVFNPKAGQQHMGIGEPCEVLEMGTGFMMIPRRTLEKFSKAFPQYAYRPDHIRTKEFDGSKKIMQYFQAEIDPKSERYLSEDYWFTQKCQEIGLKTWLCPWMSMTHMGSYLFGGSLRDLASISVSPTADPTALRKG